MSGKVRVWLAIHRSLKSAMSHWPPRCATYQGQCYCTVNWRPTYEQYMWNMYLSVPSLTKPNHVGSRVWLIFAHYHHKLQHVEQIKPPNVDIYVLQPNKGTVSLALCQKVDDRLIQYTYWHLSPDSLLFCRWKLHNVDHLCLG